MGLLQSGHGDIPAPTVGPVPCQPPALLLTTQVLVQNRFPRKEAGLHLVPPSLSLRVSAPHGRVSTPPRDTPQPGTAAQLLTSEKSIPKGKTPNVARRWARSLPGPLQSPALPLPGWPGSSICSHPSCSCPRKATPVSCLCCAQVSLLSVDDMYQNLPPTVKDKYWNESTAQPPYTTATAAETLKPSFLGSTFDMR